MKVKVGIFFGGATRNWANSFAGGRTVFNNLNKSIFEPVPIFVDAYNNVILLDTFHMYEDNIIDFYPEHEKWDQLSQEEQTTQISKVGKRLAPLELPQLVNIAFLALFESDGQIQRQLDELQIPYTGSNGQVQEVFADKTQLQNLAEEYSFNFFDSPTEGNAFSCLVMRQEDNSVVAIPASDITNSITDIQFNAVRQECERFFLKAGLQSIAQIQGLISADDTISLTTIEVNPGFASGGWLYQCASEIGFNPSALLSFVLRISLQERIQEHPDVPAYKALLKELDGQIAALKELPAKKRIGVILGGYPLGRTLSEKSGRTIFELLASSEEYEPIPYYLHADEATFDLYQIPVSLLMVDNFDKLQYPQPGDGLKRVQALCEDVSQKYGTSNLDFSTQKIDLETLGQSVDVVFIALHGRPGEDGQLQEKLEAHSIAYTGSDVLSSNITIDKFKTLQILERNRFDVPYQYLAKKEKYEEDQDFFYETIEGEFSYPFIAKPFDSGSGSAVKLLQKREELESYVKQMFRSDDDLENEFPRKEEILFESQITAKGANRFLEITGHILTHHKEDGILNYEVFEPSEYLANEHKFITPAKFADEKAAHKTIAKQVKKDLENAARVLNLQGYAQLDAFVRVHSKNNVETILFEVNALPLITSTSPILQQAALQGYHAFDLIDNILTFSIQKHQPKVAPEEEALVVAEVVATVPNSEEPEPLEVEEKPVPIVQKETVQNDITYMEDSPPIAPPEPQSPVTFTDKLKAFALKVWTPIWAFLKSRPFLKNFGALLGILLLLFFLFNGWLRFYTNHDESLTVHDYVGMPLDEAKKKAREQSFSLTVIDSTFGPDYLPYEIFQQDPAPMSRVKENRTIYVSVYHRSARDVTLPSLVGNYDFEQYKKKLKRKRIDAIIRERIYDGIQEENTILHFFYNDQKITQDDVKKGFKVPEGSVLEFVVTERQTGFVPLPNLVCQRYKAATFLVSSNQLNLGNVFGDVADQDNAYVWKQEPAFQAGQMIQIGRQVDIYLTDIRPGGCPEE